MAVNVLQSCQVFSQLSLDYRQGLQNLFEFVCFEDHDLADVVYLFAENVELGDDADRTFPTNKQLLEVEAGIILVNLGTEVQNIPVWRNCLEAQDVRPQRPILYYVFAASVS
jgi:hypothetical protein